LLLETNERRDTTATHTRRTAGRRAGKSESAAEQHRRLRT
jgi:hypothetical protein